MTDALAPAPVGPARFREALAALPSGVAVITSVGDGGAWCGATVSAFMSLSLDPPLVLMSLASGARTARAAQASGAFVAHIVGDGQRDIALSFAADGADKFGGLALTPNGRGAPVLHDFDVSLECALHAVHPGGDHLILVGLVEAVNARGRGAPAVWYDRAFHGLHSAA